MAAASVEYTSALDRRSCRPGPGQEKVEVVRRMRILLTNDDGIDSPGIAALYDALHGLGEIFPVAPLTVQSATVPE